MANWTKSDLKTQFNRAKANGWIGAFISAALKWKFPPEILLAVASRESNIVNKRGDFRKGRYNGYGLMQLDIGSHKEWIESGAWKDPNLGIHKGAEALWQKRREVANYYKNDKRKWTEHDLLRTAIASYNHGSKDSYHDLKARNNPDEDTTGHDYSTDVLKRAEVFKELLATLNLGEPVISNDISDFDSATPTTPAEPSVSPSTVQTGTVSPSDGPPAPAVVAGTIPSIPPLPTSIPDALKRFFKWVGGLSISSYIGSLVFFRDHPELLSPILALLKIVFVGLSGVGAVVAVMFFLERIQKARQSNELNQTRLATFADPSLVNVDLKGWKSPQGEGKQ